MSTMAFRGVAALGGRANFATSARSRLALHAVTTSSARAYSSAGPRAAVPSVSSTKSWHTQQAALSSVLPLRTSMLSRGRNMSSYPSHTVLEMPALSPTMTTGNIATFKFKIGDKVSPGDLICDIETDKATIGWEAQEEGYIAAILVPEGTQDVPVGKPVLIVADSIGDVAAFKDYTPTSGGAAAAAAAPAAAAAAAPAAAPAAPGKTYPSHQAMEMPALSPTMTAGNIAAIKVKPGDKIAPGDLLMDIETDKATMGWEAQEDGIVAKVLVSEGDQEVAVGQVVLVMVDDAADIAAFSDYSGAKTPSAAAPAAAAPTRGQPREASLRARPP